SDAPRTGENSLEKREGILPSRSPTGATGSVGRFRGSLVVPPDAEPGYRIPNKAADEQGSRKCQRSRLGSVSGENGPNDTHGQGKARQKHLSFEALARFLNRGHIDPDLFVHRGRGDRCAAVRAGWCLV